MLEVININTHESEEFINISRHVQETVTRNNVRDGIVTVYIPHTTAGVTINENADPDVQRDILFALQRAVPDSGFHHIEGNSTAHVKSTIVGQSVSVIVHEGKLLTGTWQSIYFCEFDGPRNRKIYVKIVPHG